MRKQSEMCPQEIGAVARTLSEYMQPRDVGGYDGVDLVTQPIVGGEMRQDANGNFWASFDGGDIWYTLSDLRGDPSRRISALQAVEDAEGRPLGVPGEGVLYIATINEVWTAFVAGSSPVRVSRIRWCDGQDLSPQPPGPSVTP